MKSHELHDAPGVSEPKAAVPLLSSTRKTSFKGDVLRLVSGTGAAQIIALLAAPILTRLYAPEAFGLAALFASVTGILGVLACMRYELSIVLPDTDREAANLLAVSLLFSGLVAGLTIPLCWFGSAHFLQWVRMPDLAPYLWMVPVMVLIHGIFIALNYWNTRTKHFTRLSIARVTSAMTNTSGSLGAGFAGHATGGSLIGASIGGQAVATTVLGGQIWRDNGRFILASITWREIWAGVKRHRKFPMYSTGAALFNAASLQFAPLALAGLYGVAIAGLYALTLKVLSMPASFLGGAVGNVFFSRAPQARKEGKLAELLEKLHGKLSIIGIPALVVLLFAGPDLFALVFGEQWRKAGQYAQWMAPWIYLQFQWSPLSTLASVLELQREALVLQVLTFAARVGSLLVSAWCNASADVSIAVFAAVSAIAYLARQAWFLRRAGVSVRRVMVHDATKIVYFGLLASPVLLAALSRSATGMLLALIYVGAVTAFWFRRLAKEAV